MNMALVAEANLFALQGNQYPGRGIIIGRNQKDDHFVQVYWIMGRSENSRNRVFASSNGLVWTEPADPSKVEDPSLIIYDAMSEKGGNFVVSNGSQTNTALRNLSCGNTFLESLEEHVYEPDAPNFTPRITGLCSLRPDNLFDVELAILRKSEWGDWCDRMLFQYDTIEAGFGFCITTYSGDGNPLPAFRGEPLVMPLSGDIEEVAYTYWEALNQENKVSLVVKFIAPLGRSNVYIINKHKRVG